MALGFFALGVVFAACTAPSAEVQPKSDTFFFPTGAAISPDEDSLFVLNANSDLRFDSGTLVTVDLDEVDSILTPWLSGDESVLNERDCEVDTSTGRVLVCNEAEAIKPERSVRMGNFATNVDVQELDDGTLRLFVPVRGDPSLTWIDYDPATGRMDCGGEGSLPRCDSEHRLSKMRGDDEELSLMSEPYGVHVDSVGGFVFITHLIQGTVTLANAPKDGGAPVLSDVLFGVFARDSVTNRSSALGVASRTPGGRVYVTSRSEERVQVFTVARVTPQFPALLPSEFFFLRGVTPSDDAREIEFSDDGNTAYVINRSPPMLHVLDTSLDETGVPRNTLVAATEICSDVSDLVVVPASDTRTERVYVSCFRAGQVWQVDPLWGQVQAIIEVGRGPQSLVLAKERGFLYVTNFLEDTLSVVDVRPGESTENRTVLKLGRARQVGGN